MSKKLIDRAEVTISLKDFEALKKHKRVSEVKIERLIQQVDEFALEINLARNFIKHFARQLHSNNKRGIKALVNLKHHYPDIYDAVFMPQEMTLDTEEDE